MRLNVNGGPERAAQRPEAARSAGLLGPRSDGAPERGAPRQIRIPAGGHVTLELGGPVEAGYQIVGDELRPLPAGSTLDAITGTFSWQPPEPFIGEFHLVFTRGGERQDVIVTIGDPTADAR